MHEAEFITYIQPEMATCIQRIPVLKLTHCTVLLGKTRASENRKFQVTGHIWNFRSIIKEPTGKANLSFKDEHISPATD